MPDTGTGPVGERLRELRRTRGWTLRDVEERSEGRFTVGSLGAYERGTRMITAERLVALCLVYDVDPNSLFDGVEDQPAVSVVIDLTRVEVSDELDLARLCDRVRRMRRGQVGNQIELRESDLDRLAALRGVSFDTLVWQLRESGLAVEAEVRIP